MQATHLPWWEEGINVVMPETGAQDDGELSLNFSEEICLFASFIYVYKELSAFSNVSSSSAWNLNTAMHIKTVLRLL